MLTYDIFKDMYVEDRIKEIDWKPILGMYIL